MKIEVAAREAGEAQVKGTLLEKLAKEFLATQQTEVETQVRIAYAELDLLCKHKISGRQIYVECKAHRQNLGAGVLKSLLGTISIKEYDEGWLISAGPLGKDAKGFQDEWEGKPTEKRSQLSIYTPARVVSALSSAKLIQIPSISDASNIQNVGVNEVDWILLICEFGRFWVTPIMASGLAKGVRVLAANNCKRVQDRELLRQLNEIDSSLKSLDFLYEATSIFSPADGAGTSPSVVEVQHGETWSDYRPSRPQDFVGRANEQTAIFDLVDKVRKNATITRIFAITGDAGMGKSSLIAKIRSRSRNKRNKCRTFVSAIDCRAASSANYVPAALLECLNDARSAGFGAAYEGAIEISDPSNPLASRSVADYLKLVAESGKVIVLIFDQFEELYAKSDLYEIFEEARKLFLSANAAQLNILIGFAWRTDATIQLSHPAYHTWHQLSDQRLEVPLRPLSQGESGNAVSIFENEIGSKLRPEVRWQILEHSQGYPWLLKKICIYMYKQLKDGKGEAESIETLDVSSLFDDDVRGLQPKEASCLKFIAKNAPIDWSEIIENFGQDSISILHERRLIIRSGDRLNIYWDIFREYLNTGEAPKVPFSYLPSVSISSIITVGCLLKHAVGTSHAEISEIVGLREGTIGNVVRDLRMFGIAAGTGALPTLLAGIPENDPKGILRKLREVLERHSFLIELRKMSDGAVLRPSEIQELIQDTHSIPDFSPDTLRSNAGRICIWLAAAGYLQNTSAGWRYGDQGEIDLSHVSRKRRDWRVFNGSAPPPRALEVLEKLRENGILSAAEASNPGYEKALNVLSRFELAVQFENSSWKLVAPDRFDAPADAKTRLWNAAKKQESLKAAVDFMKKNSNADGMELANYLEKEFDETWAEGSKRRTGNALRRWGDWIIEGERLGSVPTPKEGIRGRRKGWRKKT